MIRLRPQWENTRRAATACGWSGCRDEHHEYSTRKAEYAALSALLGLAITFAGTLALQARAEIEAPANLVCTGSIKAYDRDPGPYESTISIDFTGRKVDGASANISDKSISWLNGASSYLCSLDRFTGALYCSHEGTAIRANCMPAQKRF